MGYSGCFKDILHPPAAPVASKVEPYLAMFCRLADALHAARAKFISAPVRYQRWAS
jgi:hypothetical protein